MNCKDNKIYLITPFESRRRIMKTSFAAAFVAIVMLTPMAKAQDGAAQRVGQALDNAGKNIRRGVENGVARGQISAQERELLARVYHRIHWDKSLVNSTIQFEVQLDGTTILRGAVADEAAKKRAIDLAQSTVGVTSVVDELVIGKEVKVIQALPVKPGKVIVVTPAVEPVVVTPAEPVIIIKKP